MKMTKINGNYQKSMKINGNQWIFKKYRFFRDAKIQKYFLIKKYLIFLIFFLKSALEFSRESSKFDVESSKIKSRGSHQKVVPNGIGFDYLIYEIALPIS